MSSSNVLPRSDELTDEESVARDVALNDLEQPLSYRDDAEGRVLNALVETADRSAGSDALAARIEDWGTRYHFSPTRLHLLLPFSIGPEHRVLEIGAGCGALTRWLGERGADVVAVEGNPNRARAISLRCSDLDNVQVHAGDFAAFEDRKGFDVVLVVGVLEYSGAASGGGDGPAAMLDRIAEHLRSDGVLVLAIENQLGLQYLAGRTEDHLGLSWIGVHGYPGSDVRTWSRRHLSELLSAAGLSRHQWLFPFPDYKLPTTILTEAAYEEADAATLIDQLVRDPLARGNGFEGELSFDLRQAHRSLVGAGIGPEVANSFMICATREAGDPNRLLDPDSLAWLFTRTRQFHWRRMKTITGRGKQRRVTARRVDPRPVAVDEMEEAGWLRQKPVSAQIWYRGHTLEQLALEACAARDEDRLKHALDRWIRYLDRHKLEPAPPSADDPVHPYRKVDTGDRLPADMLDVDLANFVATSDKDLVYVDDEWCAGGSVDLALVRLRALWHLAVDLVVRGFALPSTASFTVDTLTLRLAKLCRIPANEELLDEMRAAEAALLHDIRGGDDGEHRREVEAIGGWSGHQNSVSALSSLREMSDVYEEQIARMRGQIDAFDRVNARQSHELFAHHLERQRLLDELDSLQTENQRLHTELTHVERSRVARWYRGLRARLQGRRD